MSLLLRLLVVTAVGYAISCTDARAQTVDLSAYYDQVYQIRVTNPKAGGKSSIGSGFQVSSDGLIATNYHVIADEVQRPELHSIEYRTQTGAVGKLTLLDFDVINDLALLRIDQPSRQFFTLAQNSSAESMANQTQGGLVFALGNPQDFGVTLVQGFNNGVVDHSYNKQLLFSGSLNPGMSGGPTLNSRAEVVGVNVATAGSQLSFLIPVEKLQSLIRAQRQLNVGDYQTELASQIKNWQSRRLQQLIDIEWAEETFADRSLFGEIRNDFQCWGDTNESDENRDIDWISKSCNAADRVYLSNDVESGQIQIYFTERRSDKLNSFQFTRSLSPDMGADNRSNFENSTEYQCASDFLESDRDESYLRVSTCIRAYKKLEGLYDSLLSVEEIADDVSFIAHLSIAGAEQKHIQALNKKFTELSK